MTDLRIRTATADDREVQDDAVMAGWARTQVGPWLLEAGTGTALPLAPVFDELNAIEGNVFLFSLDGGRVTLHDKPERGRHPLYHLSHGRARGYQMWFESAAQKYLGDLAMRFAVFVGDAALAEPQVPVFSFQKPLGNRSLLMPDPDMLGRGFPTANDRLRFDEKACRAIFAGATSGGLITAAALAADGATPRIRAALHFRNHPDVDFLLPVIGAYDSEQTAAMLRGMGFGDNRKVEFARQLENKFILSMDGNGATCTRVSITLSSNSVLLKFDSPSILYYFQGLQPWVHYLPIGRYAVVTAIIAQERRRPGLFAPVTAAAQDFAARFLTRDAALRYTAILLRQYHDLVHLWAGTAPPPRRWLKILAHVGKRGDLWGGSDGWAGLPGSGLEVQGIRIEGPASLSYEVVARDGSLSPPAEIGAFCGTRGRSLPVHGFRVSGPPLRCWARFIDGTELGPVESGTVCHAPSGAPLDALRVESEG